jgi:predicted NUDIX family phosphoesterase
VAISSSIVDPDGLQLALPFLNDLCKPAFVGVSTDPVEVMNSSVLAIDSRALGALTRRVPAGRIQRASPHFDIREVLERDERRRQIIPYVLLTSGDTILTYVRSEHASEERLRGSISLGFGGHIDFTDAVYRRNRLDLARTIRVCAEREVAEEVGAVEVLHREFLGVIADESTPVGRVHLGWCERWECEKFSAAESTDAAVAHLEVHEMACVLESAERLEDWSRVALSLLG